MGLDLHHIVDALFAKLWWNFKTSTTSLWSTFMWNKYYKRLHPVIAKAIGASHVWRNMIEVREVVEHNIWWQVKSGRSSFWFDNWTKLGALYFIETINNSKEELDIRDFVINGQWNKHKLSSYLSDPEIVDHICDKVDIPTTEKEPDKS